MPLNRKIKKVLVIGSGPIVIGQAAEFDYAGNQACRVLKQAGLNVVLVNSNPATIMTDTALADEIYLEPLTAATVKRIIEKERPDSLLASLGGQTGLTIAMQLSREGYLEKAGVRLLGTSAEAIDKAEDRRLFRDTMKKLRQPVIPSEIATTVEQAVKAAADIGYPVITRPAFTLGGAGGGVAENERELRVIARTGLTLSPISQILVERYIAGWKEIEFEVMRDGAGNAIAVCCMENLDPVGVHTGDSIVVAPAMTLADHEYQMLRSASLDIIAELGIEGGCNCQFALDPESFRYTVIEVNPRVSRSSALASKATGYPIAKVAAKIALGYTLDEIPNDVTGRTTACFEPTVDYVVCKLPKWPFDKFPVCDRTLGTQMKATGEVMAIGSCFEAAVMKAVRGAELGLDTLDPKTEEPDIRAALHRVDDRRLFTVFSALKRGVSVEEIHGITRIDRWFLGKLKNLADYELALAADGLTEESYRLGKRYGYTDRAIERISGRRVEKPARLVYKMVDTCAAEFAAATPYFYSMFGEHCEARPLARGKKERVVVLGSGPIRIGQGIEFDYSSVHCVMTLKELGYEVIIINNNPETVSTDFDTADRLYFEPLTFEDVMQVLDVEKPFGVVVAFGGQTAINLTHALNGAGVRILGTSAEGIDLAEDRARFDSLLGSFGIRRPKGLTALTLEQALAAAEKLGYPVLLRPSYVIGGQNMTIAWAERDVRQYMALILAQGIRNPVLIDQYLMGAELEVDVLCDGMDVLLPGIMQHIERAGVHSGDSIAVYPPYRLSDRMIETVVSTSTRLAVAMGTRGLVNIQYLIYKGELYVIEVNPRASRTVPYLSKVTGLPMVDIATRLMLGASLKSLGYGSGLYRRPPYVAVKVPVFSFEKLLGVNSSLSPEMKSTGEVLGIGKTLEEALFKGLLSAGFRLARPKAGGAGVLLSVAEKDRGEVLEIARKFDRLGFRLYATDDNAPNLRHLGADVESVGVLGGENRIRELLEGGKIAYLVMTGPSNPEYIREFVRVSRRALLLSIPCLTSLDTAGALADMLASRYSESNTELVDIAHLRRERRKLRFVKMEGNGDDVILFENFDGSIPCPESLSALLADRHSGVGGTAVALVERSRVADAKMRVFNPDGSEDPMDGDCIRCVGKYLYDRGIVPKLEMTIETASGVRGLTLLPYGGEVRFVRVDMGKPELQPGKIPVKLGGGPVIGRTVAVAGGRHPITCVGMGSPHCVVFCKCPGRVCLPKIGPQLEDDPIFPEGVSVELASVVNADELAMRIWERGCGETPACGAGACAAAVAAVENGFFRKDSDIAVCVPGGRLSVRYTGETVFLTGEASLIYSGEVEI